MAHIINLAYGSEAINLASGDYRVTEYVMQSADVSDGADLLVESMRVLITATDLAGLQADLQALNIAMEAARKRAEGRTWQRLYVQAQTDGSTQLYQSEIISGRVVLPASALSGDWANRQMEVTLIYTRRPYWESASWVAVPISNSNGLDNTTGLRVYNCADASGTSPNVRVNHVNIGGAQIIGDLPGPAKLVMRPAQNLNGIYIGQYVDEQNLGLPLMHRDSHQWTPTFAGSYTTSGATYSGGNCIEWSILSMQSVSDEDMVTISLPMSSFRGAWLRPFLRCTGLQALMQATIRFAVGGAVISESSPALSQDNSRVLRPLGMMRIPPYPYLGSAANGTLTFHLKRNPGVDWFSVFRFDAFYFFGTDGYAEIGRDDSGVVGSGSEFVETWDADQESYVQLINGSGQYRFCNIRLGQGIFLVPTRDQQLQFLMRREYASDITANMLVWLYYKPRRRTL